MALVRHQAFLARLQLMQAVAAAAGQMARGREARAELAAAALVRLLAVDLGHLERAAPQTQAAVAVEAGMTLRIVLLAAPAAPASSF